MRILSGIQPSGALHIGNYFGAIRQYIRLQEENDGFYFIANYHALTSLHDRERLRQYTLDVALDFLALGLDPKRATLFVQSDVPEVCELTWLLSCITPMGLLERCHAYKDKVQQGISADHGLFAYPVLMAADILIYQSDLVPVGQDQKQHIEVTRDIAVKFNLEFGETFKVPEPFILDNTAIVPGVDGRKMSKSYGNTIEIFEDEKSMRKKIMSIVTDSTPVEDPKDPDTCNVFALYQLFAPEDKMAEMRAAYLKGGIGYGTVKKELAGYATSYFAPAREKRLALEKDLDYVKDVLREGGKRARGEALKTIARAVELTGIYKS
jgi:tryptophanyl-tRNA synthetase